MGAAREPPRLEDLDGDSILCGLLCAVLFAGLVFSFVTFIVIAAANTEDPPEYSVAIASASGLDHYYPRSSASPPPRIDPRFNLTVRVACKSSKSPACLSPTTSVHVRYMGVQLASERVPPGLCAAPRRSEDLRVVARGQAVAMSPFMLETLAEDVRNGDALFKVRLMSPHGDYWEVYTCMAKIGKPAAKCSQHYVDAPDMLPPQTTTHTDQ